MDKKVEEFEKIKNYFAFGIQAAQIIAEKGRVTLGEAVSEYTTLRGRIIFPSDDPDSDWTNYAKGLDLVQDPVKWTIDFYSRFRSQSDKTAGRFESISFGCFSYDYANDTIYIHFYNSKGEPNPLSQEHMNERLEDLRQMFKDIKEKHPECGRVSGHSWLYNLEQYRRLFPKIYTDSRVEVRDEEDLSSATIWGQFFDNQHNLKPDISEKFLSELKKVDMDHIFDAFPFKPLAVKGPVQDFYDLYGIS